MSLAFINIGHIHPLLVHLPIGIILLVFVLEIIYKKRGSEESNGLIQTALFFGLLASVLTLITGWKLGASGEYEGDILRIHKWVAVAFTLNTALLFFLKKYRTTKTSKGYWILLISSVILLIITGHYGATMTHGEGFLFEEKENVEVEIKDVSRALLYQDIVRPILQNQCSSCHNSAKANGGLVLTSKEDILKGGDTGTLFNADLSSSIIRRLHLSLNEKEHMPPKGNKQLSEDQLFYIEWWVENQSCFDCIVKDLNPTEKELFSLRKLERKETFFSSIEKELDDLNEEALQELTEKRIGVTRLNGESSLLRVNMSHRQDITEEQIQALTNYAEYVVELNLSNSNFSVKWGNYLSDFENLTKLQLSNTVITDESLGFIEDFSHLESLNVYSTTISDESLKYLKNIKELKRLYIWQTNISEDGKKQLTQGNPTLELIDQYESPLFAESKLEKPEILISKQLFYDTLHVQLKSDFENVRLFYTLDGTLPDTSSIEYMEPFVIDQSSEISAISFKNGWGKSKPEMKSLKKKEIRISTIAVQGAVHENYKSSGSKALIDNLLGTLDFRDGNWMGFQGNSPRLSFQLEKEKEISSISVSALSAQPSWIFYPSGFTVWVMNKLNQWEQVHYSSVSSIAKNPDTERKFFNLQFEPVYAKKVKVQIESPLKNPKWHSAPGEDSYVFIDEILVE